MYKVGRKSGQKKNTQLKYIYLKNIVVAVIKHCLFIQSIYTLLPPSSGMCLLGCFNQTAVALEINVVF